jgi:hypothetical protein
MVKKNHKTYQGLLEYLTFNRSPHRLPEHFNRDDPDVLEFLKWLYLKPLLSIFLNTKTDYHEL